MEENAVNVIRESTRNLVKNNRRFQRDEESDGRRCVENMSITPETIVDIANKLKTKCSVSVTELQQLKNGLVERAGSAAVVLGTHGALRGLVRELTGSDVSKQCLSASCCANLALEGAECVARAAGAYLLAGARSQADELAESCIWALGNISTCPRACAILASQGAGAVLAGAIGKSEGLYALTHYTRQRGDELGVDHLTQILHVLSSTELTKSSAQLLSIVSCHKDFNQDLLTEEFVKKILEHLKVCIQSHLKDCRTNDCCEILYLIRTLANVPITDELYSYLMEFIIENDLIDSFKMLIMKDDDVSKSVLWFLGNLYRHRCDSELFGRLLN